MKMNDMFPSKYLKADDIQQPLTVTIRSVIIEEVGPQKDERPVMYFAEVVKGLILNKTVSTEIVNLTDSEDTDHWVGRQIQLYRGMTMFQGRQTPCIRTRPPVMPHQSQPVQPMQGQPQQPHKYAPLQPGQADWGDVPDPGEPIRR